MVIAERRQCEHDVSKNLGVNATETDQHHGTELRIGDLLAGNPATDISALRRTRLVMKGGIIVKRP